MKSLGFGIGILAVAGMAVAFIPLLGWMNWGVIPVAVFGLLFGIIGMVSGKRNRNIATAGIILNAIAIIGGSIRLMIGGGFF